MIKRTLMAAALAIGALALWGFTHVAQDPCKDCKGCCGEEGKAHGKGHEGICVMADHHNGTFQVPVGGYLHACLPSNPTTGYGWQIKSIDSTVIKPVGKPVFEKPSSNAVGAPGFQVFQFQGVARGQSVVTMVYVRPWEKTKPAKTFRFTVGVY